jgi:hypothetical protein
VRRIIPIFSSCILFFSCEISYFETTITTFVVTFDNASYDSGAYCGIFSESDYVANYNETGVYHFIADHYAKAGTIIKWDFQFVKNRKYMVFVADDLGNSWKEDFVFTGQSVYIIYDGSNIRIVQMTRED